MWDGQEVLSHSKGKVHMSTHFNASRHFFCQICLVGVLIEISDYIMDFMTIVTVVNIQRCSQTNM